MPRTNSDQLHGTLDMLVLKVLANGPMHGYGIATRLGVVESINTTIKAVLRRARGMRDETMLVLKLKWVTARPIRTARDVMRFLHPEGVHSLG